MKIPVSSRILRRIPVSLTLSIVVAFTLHASPAYAAVETFHIALPANRIITQDLTEPATGVGLTIRGEGNISMQTLENGIWSPWKEMALDPDADPALKSSDLMITDKATSVRLKSSVPIEVDLHGISVDQAGIITTEASTKRITAPVVIPRWQWGADESLRFAHGAPRQVERAESFDAVYPDSVQNCSLRSRLYPEEFKEINRQFFTQDGDPLWWPIGYSPSINLFVIHHTATPTSANKGATGPERMNAIYQYHAVARRWGDIGYNYVIDPDGNVYEGRAGGPKVVGAHAFCNNVGTIGISLMGNFQIEKPSDEQISALRLLIATLAKEHGIDPAGQVVHHGKLMPTIIDHRAVGQTACAGEFLHELLPQIRIAVKNQDFLRPIFSTRALPSTKAEAPVVEYPDTLTLGAGNQKTFDVKLMNTGMETWTSDSWLLGEGSDVYFTQYRPYSFVAGFMKEDAVKPGEIGTFEVKMQAAADTKGGRQTVRLTPVINNKRRIVNNVVEVGVNLISGKSQFTPVVTYFPQLHIYGQDLTGVIKIINSGSVPWEKDTITGIDFAVEGGKGEVSILSAPDRVEPGKQGSFEVRLLNVKEEGRYTRTIVPEYIGGSTIKGSSILVASTAAPLPPIMQNPEPKTELLAQSQKLYRQEKVSTYNGVTVETTIGTDLTLSPNEQVGIPIRIRAGENGLAKSQAVADMSQSSNALILRDEQNLRIRNTMKSPVALRRFQTWTSELLLKAPPTEGTYTFSIGEIQFSLTVRGSGRYQARTEGIERISRRTASQAELRRRSLARRERLQPLVPVTPPKSEGAQIVRIRLSHDGGNSASLTGNSPIIIERTGGIITATGTIHLEKSYNQCKAFSGAGHMIEDIVRFRTQDPKGILTISSSDKIANTYRGILECRIMDDRIVFINELPIEDYLAGLAEEPDTEPWEKQKAFAVAARSYALYYVLSSQRKFPGMPYDGDDSPRTFQKYLGYSFEQRNPRWVESVKETAGEVLTWERKIVKPPYHSNNDGRIRSAQEVWGWKHTPYLSSKPDPGCIGLSNAGHLVGMSGCGAKAKAIAGEGYKEILQYYYPGTKILPYSHESVNGGHTN